MSALHSQGCEPCRSGAALLTEAEIEQLKKQIPDWKIITEDGIQRLIRSYNFKTFRQALAFTNRVAEIAEAEQHHPAILTEWGKVTVSWWTHKIGGLHRNDFIMAAKTDQLYTGI
jgi:4a-hydroxytetrahydrobiopterin dehydratase